MRNIDALNKSFDTPMDREEIYRASISIYSMAMFAQTIATEMSLLGLLPNQFTKDMANLLREGSEALKRGYTKLSVTPSLAEEDVLGTLKLERMLARIFRNALVDLYNADAHITTLLEHNDYDGKAAAMVYVTNAFKYREIYRHLYDGGRTMGNAANVLHEIVVQLT